jgi:hypothetical protein
LAVLASFWLCVGGCGGAQTRGAAREATPTAGLTSARTEEGSADPRAEIERLEREIAAQSGAVPPEPAQPGQVPGVTRSPGASDGEMVCEQACQATGSICQAARRICSLADEMDDDWARGRCRTASRTCTSTRRRATNTCGTC